MAWNISPGSWRQTMPARRDVMVRQNFAVVKFLPLDALLGSISSPLM
jgi:hypothetical protein